MTEPPSSAVARMKRNPEVPLKLLDSEGLPREPGSAQVAMVSALRLALTGTQVSFGFQEADARLALGPRRGTAAGAAILVRP